MVTSYLPYEPNQQFLVAPSLQEWLPEGHLAYFISDTVDSLDLSAFHAVYDDGKARHQPFHPAMMLKVLIYAYATGVFSSRKIARRLHEDVAFRVLAANNFPAHRTICDFRVNHLQRFSELFVQVVRIAGECGLVKLGTVAVDGTKIKANAGRHKAMSYGHMVKAEARLKDEIKGLLNQAKQTDHAERDQPEQDIPSELARRRDRLEVIRAAKARLEARQAQADTERGRRPDDQKMPRDKDGQRKRGGPHYKREFGVPQDRNQDSFTDPDSRIMMHGSGAFEFSDNGHTAVDAQVQIVIAAGLTNNGTDNDRLPVLLEAFEANTGRSAKKVLADTGFRGEKVLQSLQHHPSRLYVAQGRESKGASRLDAKRSPFSTAMARKLRRAGAKKDYARRKAIVEPPNGWIKNVLGWRQFSLRGLDKCAGEWQLITSALNLRRMHKLMAM